MTSIIWIVAIVLASFTVAYIGYGRYLSQFVDLDDDRETPAHKYEDGQEYVPAKKPVLLGHHYSSIAGGAPIVGPITAAFIWGWVPAVLWVAIGNPLIGAVHDFTSLTSSIRHEGKSIGYIIGEYVGERGKNMLLWFAFLLIILVAGVFALVIGVVFDAYPAVATAGVLYIGLALLFGVWLYQLNLSFIGGTVIFVAGVFATVWVGIQYPIAFFGEHPDGVFVLSETAPVFIPELLGSANIAAWVITLLLYGGAASILPVWVLLQPRDYLSSYLLYTGVGGGLLAIIVGVFLTGPSAAAVDAGASFDIQLEAWYGFFGGESPFAGALPLMPLFPLLFLTIACGTISGFHSLVSSGTTAKQLNRETDARLIGYGGMLGEGLLASVALVTVAVVAVPETPDGGIALALPNFAQGGGAILTALGIPFALGEVFMALVLSAFLLTSMDTAVRLGRYMAEEAIGTPETSVQEYGANQYVNTGVIVVAAFLLVASGRWADLWTLFGGANQLLAAMALLTVTIWLANWDETKQLVSTGVPLLIMAVITIAGLLWVSMYQVLGGRLLGITAEAETSALGIGSAIAQILIALTLVVLALSLLRMGYGNLREMGRIGDAPAATDGGDGSRDDD
ncbi:carbon starvation protein CstA [Natronomonas pharaonis DSM 2160]|uniref:Carbon starvation protein CstA n=1 Tax=Natronomonas pharaonis (strain ATCC 35678 / DSM 2160 / CIP 103997 / JCM 8858 / NBRC 14720 / NCIMB 2260 / Gabara) TaxID=348780 RepID=A0A1U7EVE9_NATPD|nr:carbon starvation CstA family protein [Natronomonas pharaonis]CAI48996.1 carbon starvation protein CstA [Natronomonas pharaonis DSM 2160]